MRAPYVALAAAFLLMASGAADAKTNWWNSPPPKHHSVHNYCKDIEKSRYVAFPNKWQSDSRGRRVSWDWRDAWKKWQNKWWCAEHTASKW